ncbi:MAG: hypothetical protein AAFO81_04205 [Pseudomonadota bacterium]
MSHQSYATCDADLDGVNASNIPDVSSYIPCADCRSVQDFPEDFVAMASNYLFHTPQGVSAVGAYAGSAGLSSLTFPVCSEDHGQCATATFTMRFNYINVPIAGEVIPVSTGVRDHVTRIMDSGGNVTEVRSEIPDSNPVFDIPTDNGRDTISDGECRENNGEERDGGGDSGSNDNGNGGGPGGGAENGSGGGGGTGAGGAQTGSGGSGGGVICHTTMTDNEIILTCRLV